MQTLNFNYYIICLVLLAKRCTYDVAKGNNYIAISHVSQCILKLDGMLIH